MGEIKAEEFHYFAVSARGVFLEERNRVAFSLGFPSSRPGEQVETSGLGLSRVRVSKGTWGTGGGAKSETLS